MCKRKGVTGEGFVTLRKNASKSSMSTLLARDGRKMISDYEKLQSWVDHFSDVVNCESEVSG